MPLSKKAHLSLSKIRIHFYLFFTFHIDRHNILFLTRNQNVLEDLKETIKRNIDFLKRSTENSCIVLDRDWGSFLLDTEKLFTETLTPTNDFSRNDERIKQNKKFNYEEYYNLSKNKELFDEKHKDLEEDFLISIADKKLFIKHLAYRFTFFLELKELQNNYNASISIIKKLSKYETKEETKNRLKSLNAKYKFEEITKDRFNEQNIIERKICKDDIKGVSIESNGVELPEYSYKFYVLNEKYKTRMKDYNKIVEYTYLSFKLYYLEAGLDINEIIEIKELFSNYISVLLEKNLTPKNTIYYLYNFFIGILSISIK